MYKRPSRFALLILLLLCFLGASPVDLNEAGKRAYWRGDYHEAERLFRQALVAAPDEPLLHYHLAVTLTRLERWKEAADSYATVLRLAPTSSLAGPARDNLHAMALLARSRPSPPRDTEEAVPPPRRPRRDATDEVVIPVRRHGGNWVVEILVNDARARFLVDTGASVTVIAPDLAERLGIAADPGAAPLQLQTLSGRTEGHVVVVRSIRVGEVEARDVPAVIHMTGPDVDGILGNTFLSRFVVRLDPERATLGLKPR